MKTDSNFLKHIPCSTCGSSDANSIYDDGHEYCHKCGTYKKGSEAMVQAVLREGITTPTNSSPKQFKSVLEALDGLRMGVLCSRSFALPPLRGGCLRLWSRCSYERIPEWLRLPRSGIRAYLSYQVSFGRL